MKLKNYHDIYRICLDSLKIDEDKYIYLIFQKTQKYGNKLWPYLDEACEDEMIIISKK